MSLLWPSTVFERLRPRPYELISPLSLADAASALGTIVDPPDQPSSPESLVGVVTSDAIHFSVCFLDDYQPAAFRFDGHLETTTPGSRLIGVLGPPRALATIYLAWLSVLGLACVTLIVTLFAAGPGYQNPFYLAGLIVLFLFSWLLYSEVVVLAADQWALIEPRLLLALATSAPDLWQRPFDEIVAARAEGRSPDPEVFRGLTKSAGGN